MATTLSTDLYAPPVWADLAAAAFKGNLVIANYAMQDETLVGKPGDEVDFPAWEAMSDMVDLAETDVIVPEKLRQSLTKARIKEAGKGFAITDKAKLVGVGNAQDEAVRQFGLLAARKMDTDLYAAATRVETGGKTYTGGAAATDSKPLTFTTTAGGLKYADVVGIAGLFGDAFDANEFAGLLVHSQVWGQLMQDEAFINAAQMQGSNMVLSKGQIGQILGLNVIVTDRIAAGKGLLLKRNALGITWKRRPLIEMDRDILARNNVVTITTHYGCKRLVDDGVVDITITA